MAFAAKAVWVFQRRAEVRDPEAFGAGIPGQRCRLAKRHVPVAHGFGRSSSLPYVPSQTRRSTPSRNFGSVGTGRVSVTYATASPGRGGPSTASAVALPTIPRYGLARLQLAPEVNRNAERAGSLRQKSPATHEINTIGKDRQGMVPRCA